MWSEGYSTWSVCLCVCVSVTQHLIFHVIIRATNDINLLSSGWLHDKSAIFFTPQKTCMRMNLDHVASGHFVLGRDVFLAVESDSVKSARKAKDKLHKACERASETHERTLHGQEQNRMHMASMRESWDSDWFLVTSHKYNHMHCCAEGLALQCFHFLGNSVRKVSQPWMVLCMLVCLWRWIC